MDFATILPSPLFTQFPELVTKSVALTVPSLLKTTDEEEDERLYVTLSASIDLVLPVTSVRFTK